MPDDNEHAKYSRPVTIKLTRGVSKRSYGYEVRIEGETVTSTLADLKDAQIALDDLVDTLNGSTVRPDTPPTGTYPMGSGRA